MSKFMVVLVFATISGVSPVFASDSASSLINMDPTAFPVTLELAEGEQIFCGAPVLENIDGTFVFAIDGDESTICAGSPHINEDGSITN